MDFGKPVKIEILPTPAGCPVPTPNLQPAAPLTVVGLGASAGGLEALERFLQMMPPDSGMSFVVIQHLDPTHPSLLAEILGRATTMTVLEATEGTVVQANTVYVIPPNHDLTLASYTWALHPRPQSRRQHLPIDVCFISLGEQLGPQAVGIVLSGTGADGTLGCRAILDHSGRTLVQSPEDAAYNGMPNSVILAGNAGQVLALEQMPAALMSTLPTHNATNALQPILLHLRETTGNDFTQYKKSTLLRRIERRMQVQQIDADVDYLAFLQSNPDESQLLLNELLINVTQFFRDPEAFVVMQEQILPSLLANKFQDSTFRVWVAGCASGEEAYSVAIVLRELLQDHGLALNIQFFATDLDAEAIATARAGLYPLSTANDISAQRLSRYFTQEPTGYRVKKTLREMIVFAVHNVIKDPPFTRIDLLCCRNLMIYLEQKLQSRLIPTFHFALQQNGVLLLSPSESVGSHASLFRTLHRKWKFYRANKGLAHNRLPPPSDLSWVPSRVSKQLGHPIKMTTNINIAELTRKALLQDFGPASVVTDLGGTILYIHGDTGNYLRPAPGQASLNVIEMAREGLQLELRNAIHQAASNHEPPRTSLVTMSSDSAVRQVSLSVRRMTETPQSKHLLLIAFQEHITTITPMSDRTASTSMSSEKITLLERDLAYTRANLQATIDELQEANEELSSNNEDMQSTNEELQSSNEELETSREELQSVNEELVTVNAELQAKIEQLGDMQNDMKNLLDSINIGTIFLDTQLTIRRFTRDAAKIYRLIPKDIGRPLIDITSYLGSLDLLVPAQEVLDTLMLKEIELCTTSGNWFLARLLPYRTLDNVIDGVVMTFHDINTRKASEQAVQAARELAEAIVDTVTEPLLLLDQHLCVVSASRSYYRDFHTSAHQTAGRKLYELSDGQWNIDELREQLGTILEDNTSFDGFVVEQELPGTGRQRITLNARRVTGDGARPHLILLAMQHQPTST